MAADLKIAIVQSVLHWEDVQMNLAYFDTKMHQIDQDVDLILLPEMFTTGFSMHPEKVSESMDGASIEWMKKVAMHRQCAISGSLIIKEHGKYYNRLIWMEKSGAFQYYDKKHLFSLANEHLHYSAGDRPLIVELNGWKIKPVICYDLRFPVWLRNKCLENKEYEYDILIVVANWPQKRNTAWKTLLQARAIENQSYVIGVNRVGSDANDILYSGDSVVYDALGEVLYMKSQDEDLGIVSLQKSSLDQTRVALPFLNDADVFKIY